MENRYKVCLCHFVSDGEQSGLTHWYQHSFLNMNIISCDYSLPELPLNISIQKQLASLFRDTWEGGKFCSTLLIPWSHSWWLPRVLVCKGFWGLIQALWGSVLIISDVCHSYKRGFCNSEGNRSDIMVRLLLWVLSKELGPVLAQQVCLAWKGCGR